MKTAWLWWGVVVVSGFAALLWVGFLIAVVLA